MIIVRINAGIVIATGRTDSRHATTVINTFAYTLALNNTPAAISLWNIFAQIIDDEKKVTLVSASSIDKELKLENGGNVEAAKKVGELLAKRAKKAKISKVKFDRGGYLYHGRVKALADAARENGLEF